MIVEVELLRVLPTQNLRSNRSTFPIQLVVHSLEHKIVRTVQLYVHCTCTEANNITRPPDWAGKHPKIQGEGILRVLGRCRLRNFAGLSIGVRLTMCCGWIRYIFTLLRVGFWTSSDVQPRSPVRHTTTRLEHTWSVA